MCTRICECVILYNEIDFYPTNISPEELSVFSFSSIKNNEITLHDRIFLLRKHIEFSLENVSLTRLYCFFFCEIRRELLNRKHYSECVILYEMYVYQY